MVGHHQCTARKSSCGRLARPSAGSAMENRPSSGVYGFIGFDPGNQTSRRKEEPRNRHVGQSRFGPPLRNFRI